ncbi:MAG: protein translocase subunit SecD [Planctomycetia bacterium]|nr:protein translocase subunit SecD [Planctomycetia bacterium]
MTLDNIQLLLVILGVFILPLVLGHYISRAVRMPDQAWKIATVFFSLFASAAVAYFGWPPKLGIDLSGGSILVYEVDQQAKAPGEKVDMEKLVGAVTKRVNPGGVKEVTIRPYGVEQIEIIIPKADEQELERTKSKISSTGLLEFRITANDRDHKDLIELAKKLDVNSKQLVIENSDGTKDVAARWVPVRAEKRGYFEGGPFVTRKGKTGDTEVLMVIDPQNVTGGYLKSATASIGPKGPKVDFRFNTEGARRFGKLTGSNLPDEVQQFYRKLGIVLDGVLQDAPNINSRIEDNGEITGSFTNEQTEDLASILTAGSLPTSLRKEPSSSLLTGPTLGADTIRKGVYSMLVATVAVIAFMVVYYRFAGVVANIALLLNVLLIVAFMVLFNAAFTLSGLAGLALTVGMAVDANVLIYERMREEIARGATLRMAIRNGFDKATTTIIDANVTTLISAVVLFIIGSDQVKGFAVTLILGIIMNLYTAIFVSRVFFDIAEKTRAITDLRMLHILSNPHFDFIGKSRPAIAFSLLVIGIGMAGVVARGKGLLDIDFTGGTSVETLFNEPTDIAKVRKEIDGHRDDLPDATVQDVHIAKEQPGIRYVINTSNADIGDVKKTLAQVFEGKLTVNHLEFQVAAIPAEGTAADAPPAEGTEKPPGPSGARAKPRQDDETLLALADAAALGAGVQESQQDEDKAKADQPAVASPPTAASEEKTTDEKAAPKKPAEPRPAPSGAASTIEAEKGDAEGGVSGAKKFAGGSQATLTFTTPIGYDQLMAVFQLAQANMPDAGSQPVAFDLDAEGYELGSDADFSEWEFRTTLPVEKTQAFLTQANATLGTEPFFPSSNKIGATVASNTQQQAVVGLVASLLLILAYVWFRFSQVMFGVAAVVAVIHDVLVTLGALALSLWLAQVPGLHFLLIEPFKISLPIIAAFLTIIGYSLNDTIVIFDRIREVRGKSPLITAELANSCINQTLSRTILTSLTVFIVVLILYAVGGQGIHAFAFALVVGVVAGTYSTVYIATPIVLWMNRSSATASQVRATASSQALPQSTPAA